MKVDLKKRKIWLTLLTTLILTSNMGCSSSNDEEQLVIVDHWNKVNEFSMNIAKEGFEGDMKTRADSSWETGDKIYLLFDSQSTIVYGDAIYSDGKWIVTYGGELLTDSTALCKAYFFENDVSSTFSTVTLNEGSEIYEDTSGTYTLVDGCLSVSATLKPKTGRVCFKGYNHQEIEFSGISYYTSFNRFTGEFESTDKKLSSKVTGEYTPFCYGFFTDSEEPCIKMWTEDGKYKRYLSSDVFKPADSGYLTIPTQKDHNGWLLLFE